MHGQRQTAWSYEGGESSESENGHTESAFQSAEEILRQEDLLIALHQHHAPQQESVQLSSSWKERAAQYFLLWREICSQSSPAKRQSCNRTAQRKPNRHSTVTVVMEPDRTADIVVKLDQEKTWETPAVVSTVCHPKVLPSANTTGSNAAP